MNFELSEEQQLIQEMVKEFVASDVAPIAAEIDREHRFPAELLPQMGKLGLMGVPFAEEFGGAGADYVSYTIVLEELARACASTSVIVSAHTSLGTWPIFEFGTPAQKEKYLPGLTSGEKLGAFALTEPGAGTDAAAGQTTAVLDGDEYILNGSKIFITNGGYADVYIVTAMTDPASGTRGISAFIVEKDAPGFTVGEKEHKMGIKASSTTPLYFSDCRIPKDALLGQEGKGFKIAMQTLDGGRIGVAAQALGIAQGATDFALEYAKTRETFGEPIAEHQLVAAKLADMETRCEAARGLLYKAGLAMEEDSPELTKISAMAKLFCSDTAMDVTTEAVQILGGYGYIQEYPVERMMRDAKITQIYEGTNEIQRIVIAREMLREARSSVLAEVG